MTDFHAIIEREGYRREDLSPEDQYALEEIDWIIEQIDVLRDNLDIYDDIDNETVIGKMKTEIYNKAIDAVIDWTKSQQLELQVGMAERNA